MDKIANFIGYVIIIILMVCGISLFFTLPTWFLWNWLCPDLFGLPSISLLQTLGLLLLTGFLFKSHNSKKD